VVLPEQVVIARRFSGPPDSAHGGYSCAMVAPGCFVCGPARAPGDGLRVICGPLDGERLVADSWTPEAELAGPDGNVAPEFVWSVLDRPSGNALLLLDDLPES
jgi:hypothetical protein